MVSGQAVNGRYSNFIVVLQKMTEVVSIVVILHSSAISSIGLEIPTTHQCTDTRDGNYTCIGSLNGEYLQFYTNKTCTGSLNVKQSQFYTHAQTQKMETTPAQDPKIMNILCCAIH